MRSEHQFQWSLMVECAVVCIWSARNLYINEIVFPPSNEADGRVLGGLWLRFVVLGSSDVKMCLILHHHEGT